MDNTLLAALIGAAVASIGVTLAKDTKVSEFRQAWIDALRQDVAEFIALATRAFQEKHGLMPRKETQSVDELTILTDRMNTVMYRIILRLDLKDGPDKESQHNSLLRAVSEMQRIISDTSATREVMNEVSDDVWLSAAVLLDTAWNRVKSGEPRYRWVLRIACTTLIMCAFAFSWQFYERLRHPEAQVTHFSVDSPVIVEQQPALGGKPGQLFVRDSTGKLVPTNPRDPLNLFTPDEASPGQKP